MAGSGRERGQGIVEFALVIPIVVALILGVVELGFLLYDYESLVAGTRAAARAGAVYKIVEGCPNNDQNRFYGTGCTPAYGDNMVATLQRNTSVRLGNPPTIVDPPVWTLAVPPIDTRQGDLMTITVNYQHRFLTGFFGQATIPLSASASARIE
ncbi:MAG TPA: TadE family protein [Chloroflexota bacterium]|nr:TadE family protein [Chloroflexota bacterium]